MSRGRSTDRGRGGGGGRFFLGGVKERTDGGMGN